MAPYLNVAKVCGYNSDNECAFNVASIKTPSTHKPLSGNKYKIVLSDGAVIAFEAIVSTQKQDGITVPVIYSSVIIDINGPKAPNMYGKDVFYYVYIIDYDFTSVGFSNESGKFKSNCIFHKTREDFLGNCNKNNSGSCCAGLIMVDGWQIKDDYPW